MSETDHATERDERAPDYDSDAGPGGETNGDGLVRDARTLRVTVESVDDFFDRTGSKLERLEQGKTDTLPQEKRLSYTTVEQLFSVFTPKRIELVDTVLRTQPESISALAETVGRAVGDVHDDLYALADENVVRFEREGRCMRPIVPYDHVEIEVSLPRADDPV
jgi:predicted transcriptional regulator